MEKFVERTLLYDFYGELLTEHQQSIYEDGGSNDYSCTEVAASVVLAARVFTYDPAL